MSDPQLFIALIGLCAFIVVLLKWWIVSHD